MIAAQLSFSLPSKEYPDSSALFPAGAAVRLTCSNGIEIPIFYVTSRVPSGNSVNFTCYDRSFRTDREFLAADELYRTDADSGEKYIRISDVMSNICSVCGFAGYSDPGGIIGNIITRAKKDWVAGKKCRDILDDLSRAAGATVMVLGDNGGEPDGILTFISPAVSMGAVFTADTSKYGEICCGGVKTFDKIVMTGEGETYSAGSSSSPFGTVEIETPYASADAAGAVYGLLREHTYKSWECSKMLLDSFIPRPSSRVTFPGYGELYVNYCSISLTACGIYASLGRNTVEEAEAEYYNRTTREIKRRYRIGDVMSNVRLSDSGIEYVIKDETTGTSKSYGFTTAAGGLIRYAGAMIDTVMPTEIQKVSDTTRRIVYGGKTYELRYDKSGDTKTNIRFEEVTT